MKNSLLTANGLVRQRSGIYSHDCPSNFSYSDGAEEEKYLLQVMEEAEDVSSASFELEGYIKDWSSTYHLCSSRANLFRGFHFKEGAAALELGAGCGALTRFLGECGLCVDAVEGSSRRAIIAKKRCRGLDNVTIIQSNFNQLELPGQSYDYIFLIGVLEYAAMFQDADSDQDALRSILNKAQEALRPDGVLFVAIENRMGLKYWLGANEDHIGRPYIGLYDYPQSQGIRTYDKKSLEALFCSVGLCSFRFLYPFPDYKLPQLLLTDTFIRRDRYASSPLYRLSSQDYQASMHVECSEFLLWDGLHKNGMLEKFSNSFLVLLGRNCNAVDQFLQDDFVFFSGSQRHPKYRTITRKPVDKAIIIKEALPGRSCSDDDGLLHQDLGECAYSSGPLLSMRWLQSLAAHPDGSAFLKYVDAYWQFLQEKIQQDGSSFGNFDLLPFNIILDVKGQYIVIDEEWQSDREISAEFVLFRALLFYALDNAPILQSFYKKIGACSIYDFIVWFFKRFGLDLDDRLDAFITLQVDLVHDIVTTTRSSQDLRNALFQPLTFPQRIALPEIETVDLYWGENRESFHEGNKLSFRLGHSDKVSTCRFYLPETTEPIRYIRLDPGDRPGFFSLERIIVSSLSSDGSRKILCQVEGAANIAATTYCHQIHYFAGELGGVFVALDNDPYFVIDLRQYGVAKQYVGEKIQVEAVMTLPHSADFFLARLALQQVVERHNRKEQKLLKRIDEKDRLISLKNNSITLYYGELRELQATIQNLQNSYDLLVNSPLVRVKERFHVVWKLKRKVKKRINAFRYFFKKEYRIVDQSGLFDRTYYVSRYPDIAQAGVDPLVHYLETGWKEQRDPNPLFCTAYYVGRNPDVKESSCNPLLHYILSGNEELRDPSPVFQAGYYLSQLPGPPAKGYTLLAHYLRYGTQGTADPNPLFDGLYYLKNNPDVAASGMNPLYHYQLAGGSELRDPGPFFSTEYYIHKYPELQGGEITALEHYYRRGAASAGNELFFENTPKISILTPVYNVAASYLKNCVTSVLQQSYSNWELCLVDDGSSAAHIQPLLKEFAAADSRIKIKILSKNQGIAGATNEAASLATGEYFTFLDNDDELSLNALMEMARTIDIEDADIYYSDEDIIDSDGHCMSTHCKPDYSPDLLTSHNYITHLLVVRRSLFDRAGGLETAYDGAQDFDMVLRLTELTDKIVHIPKVLYHWRSIETSTAADPEAKGYAGEAGKKALEKALQRRKIDGKVLPGNKKFYYRVQRKISGEPLVSIIIPFKDQPDYLRRCIDSLLNRTGYQNFEIIGVDNRSEQQETADLLQTLNVADSRIRFIRYEKPFNYSAINNFAVEQAGGEHIILMNNDIEVLNVDWLESLLEHSQRPEVGAVGAKLYYKNNTIQHAGVIVGIAGFAGHSHRHFPRRSPGYFNRLYCIQNVSAVTAALLMVKKNYFVEVGGLDEENLGTALNDVDFCLKLREKGYLNVFTPYCEAYHYESVSRGYEDTPEKQERFQKEVLFFQQRWSKILAEGDPYYNPQLTLEREDFSLKVE